MFRKRRTAAELGAALYEDLRQEVAGDGVLSMEKLRRALGTSLVGVHEQYQGEAMIGCLFAAVLAIEESAPPDTWSTLRSGLEGEFYRHLGEQGATGAQVDEWRTILAEHFAEYFQSLTGHDAPPLPLALGREFLWNITGVEQDDAGLVEAATVYLMAARFVARRHMTVLVRELRL